MTQEAPAFLDSKVRVVIADDHPLIIHGITEILEKDSRFEIMETFNDGLSLLQYNSLADADVLLLDLNMPGKDGLQVLEKIGAMNLKLKILVLTSYFSQQLSEKCIAAGASGYFLKSENLDKLGFNIIDVLNGQTIYPNFSENSDEYTNEFTYLDVFLKKYNLTKREAEVIQMVCKGYNSNEIAEKLFLSSFTVQTHRRNIFRKLNIDGNTIALYKFASEHGLL
ncbi:response regulator transcription factor [Aequorivita sp. Q41]|uniref:response regulator transcription factor n=1 Tax=Aequorivita sp. Q41 TaxID=3153300 RepID=UPI0032429A10